MTFRTDPRAFEDRAERFEYDLTVEEQTALVHVFNVRVESD